MTMYYPVMVTTRWTHNTSSVCGAMRYRTAWCTKYSRDLLKDEVEKDLSRLIVEKCSELNVIMRNLVIAPDRVILEIECSDPALCPHWIVNQIRYYTSNRIRKDHKKVRSLVPSLWTRAYYCITLAPALEPDINEFFIQQRGK